MAKFIFNFILYIFCFRIWRYQYHIYLILSQF